MRCLCVERFVKNSVRRTEYKGNSPLDDGARRFPPADSEGTSEVLRSG
jgi:hypothetical protein